MVNRLIDYELGSLNDAETLQLFSELIKNGMAWSLQGHYGRTAHALIDQNYISDNGEILISLDHD